jgi:uncharacterized membrane protein YdfJ with MMPL/SSD domain
LPPFVTVLTSAVLFGHSADHEVFLVRRMRESWLRAGNNRRAVTDGLAGTGRVIMAAAAIMIAVFVAFVPSVDVVLKVVGVGMAAATSIEGHPERRFPDGPGEGSDAVLPRSGSGLLRMSHVPRQVTKW